MPSTYELILQDDTGRKICNLTGFAFFSYSRTLRGLGVFEIGFPYDEFSQKVFPTFEADRRVEIWRSPKAGVPMRREGIYLLRMEKIYTREEDAVKMIVLSGRDLKDLLNRRNVIQAAGTTYTYKEDAVDDLMKAIVREQMLYNNATDPDGTVSNDRAYPVGEFLVQGDQGLGPIVPYSFTDRRVMDVLKELQNISFQLHRDSIANERIYFDVIPVDVRGLVEEILQEGDNSPILDEMGLSLLDETSLIVHTNTGFKFVTYAGLVGQDRTGGLVFSVENNNLKSPYYSLNRLEEANSAIVKGFGRGDSREWVIVDSDAVKDSRWNRIETFVDASNEPDQDRLEDYGNSELSERRAQEKISAVFLNTEGSDDTPQSLYGIDWDLGDLLPVAYAGRQDNAEVEIVYVAVNENSVETITGRSNVNDAD